MLTMEERYLTVDEAARELGLASPDLLYRLLRIGTVRGVKRGGRWMIPYTEVELRRARVMRKRCSASYVEREPRTAVRDRFAPLAGLPGSS